MSKKHQQVKARAIGFHTGGLTLIFSLAILATFLPGPTGPRPAAANDSPVISGNTATYSGNQLGGIAQNYTSIGNIIIQNLTTNVGSSSIGTAISLLTSCGNNGAGCVTMNLNLNYTGGGYDLIGGSVDGAYLSSSGGAGANGNGSSNQTGYAGANGGNGSTVTVNMSGIAEIEAYQLGIDALSNGGAGGVAPESPAASLMAWAAPAAPEAMRGR